MVKKLTRSGWGPSTRALHSGEESHGVARPVSSPIIRTSTFTFSSTSEMKRWAEGKSKAWIYTRYGNPTLALAETRLAEMEGGEAAVVSASGTAAISTALLALLSSGDEILATQELYGGSFRLMRDVLPRFGITTKHVPANLAGAEHLITPQTRVLYVESPTNPTLRIVDLAKAAALARKHHLVSIIDGTFASPALQQPLRFGFDLVAHSATKYLAGHDDVIAGALVGSRDLVERARRLVIGLGGSMDPEAGFLLMRGMKTLGVRMRRHCENAMAVAKFLARHPKVARVHYPGLASHPDHRLAQRQMSGFGGMLAFDLKGGLPAARRFCDRVRLFLLAVSLGGVESLVVLPVYTSHYGMNSKELAAAGVGPGTVRVSVGIEDTRDLLEDLRQALA